VGHGRHGVYRDRDGYRSPDRRDQWGEPPQVCTHCRLGLGIDSESEDHDSVQAACRWNIAWISQAARVVALTECVPAGPGGVPSSRGGMTEALGIESPKRVFAKIREITPECARVPQRNGTETYTTFVDRAQERL
jgi:hypothetical protein